MFYVVKVVNKTVIDKPYNDMKFVSKENAINYMQYHERVLKEGETFKVVKEND